MTKILWYLSPYDGYQPWTPQGRFPLESSASRLITQARTIDRSRFYGALYGTYTQDTFIGVTSVALQTERMRFLVPFYPGLVAPRLLAQQAYTFDLLTQGRLLINVVNGQDDRLSQFGFPVPKDHRYRISEQYWRLFTDFYEGGDPSYQGTYLDAEHFAKAFDHEFEPVREYAFDEVFEVAADPITPIQDPHVPLWGAGGSPAGLDFAGSTVETYLAFLGDLDAVERQVSGAIEAAARHGRVFDGVGIHGSLTVRRTTREAEEYFVSQLEASGVEALAERADRGIRTLTKGNADLLTFEWEDPASRAYHQALAAGRLPELADLEISPHTYFGPASFIYSSYIVGSGEVVADELARIQQRIPQVDRFIFSGWPLQQEAEYVDKYLLPLIPDLEF